MGHEYDAMRNMEARMTKQETNFMQVSADVQALKEMAAANNTSIAELVELAQGFKFGLRILGALETAAVWITKMALAVAVVWGVWKYAIKEALASLGK